MITVYFSDDTAYFKSNKNSKEVPSLFSKTSKRGLTLRLRRINDPEYGVYHYLNIPYSKSKEWLLKELDCEFNIIDRNDFFDLCKNLNIQIAPTNEVAIRESVKKYLNDSYNIAYIQDEYTHFSLPVRADIFSVTHDRKIITVEIKSDRDTFTRLRKQLEEYDRFSHLVYVAIDIKHLPKFLKSFPSYYGGVLVFENGSLDVYNRPVSKDAVDVTKLLWKQELLQATTYFNGSFSKYSITKLEEIIKDVFTVNEFYKICEYLFVNRYLKHKLNFKGMITDIEYKKSLVKKIIS